MKALLITLMISLIMTWCGTKVDEKICTDINDPKTCKIASTEVIDIKGLHTTAVDVLTALKNNDEKKLITLMSKDGIRFSPYNYVSDLDIVMTQTNIKDITDSKKTQERWYKDWTGEPISMNFQDYRKRYIYDAKFMTDGVSYLNTKVQRWTVLNNIYDIYSGDTILEYYIPGTSKLYEGMDWKSLTIIFSKENKLRKIKGIVHWERTI